VPERIRDLLEFIDASPTPYHAVEESLRRLAAASFAQSAASDTWSFTPGERRAVVRGDGSLIALQVGAQPPAQGGFRIIGAHTDSPNLRLKPAPDVVGYGYRQLGVEVYGGVLLHTWFDRDLTLAGRVALARPALPRSALLRLRGGALRVPHLAIHLDREARESLKLNPQQHAVPVVGLLGAPELRELVARELSAQFGAEVERSHILAFDLMLADTQPASRGGANGEFLFAPRLDNLASCHAALCALLESAPRALPSFTRVVVLYDHEEVGSRSASGAWGPFLLETLGRVVEGFKGGEPQGLARALARSSMVSADMAHGVHPNYAERHDPQHAPRLGGGPVIKVNASQSYTSDAHTAGFFTALCRAQRVEPQYFVSRADLACGSTIGPITAARLGIPCVDVGNPMLSMHSCREMAGAGDVEPMIGVLSSFFEVEDD
jgi:aspartyl aminopeptidase